MAAHENNLWVLCNFGNVEEVRAALQAAGDPNNRGGSRVRKGENFPDSKIFVAKTFWIKPINCIIFQIRDKYA